jgi:chitodextrinase
MSNDYFNIDNNYKSEYNFSRVKFGINKPILETELNEMQVIQEEARASLVRQMVPSGFLEKVILGFNEAPIVFNKNESGATFVSNTIALAPSRALVGGHELLVMGKVSIGSTDNYEVLQLGDTSGTSYSATNNHDLVFLEVWFQEISENTAMKKNGNINGETISGTVVDVRVGEETSRRVGIRYRVRVAQAISYSGNYNVFHGNNIYAQGPLNMEPTDGNNQFKFEPVGSQTGDFGLFVASNGTKNNASSAKDIGEALGVLNGYVYALPMFVVKRRIKKDYSSFGIDYILHAPEYSANKVSYRPDGLFCDQIVPSDIIDIRKVVSFSSPNVNQLFDDTFRKIVTGVGRPQLVKETINLEGLSVAFDNRVHEEEIVQLVNVNPNDNYFTLDVGANNQNSLYDIFKFTLVDTDSTNTTLTFSYIVPAEFTISPDTTEIWGKINNSTDGFAKFTDVSFDEGDRKITVNELTEYTEYVFEMRVLKEGVTYKSKQVTARTKDVTAPSVPTGLAASDVTSSGVKLTWTESTDNGGSGVKQYKVYQDDVLLASTATTSYNVTGLLEYTSYTFKVVAVDNQDNESGFATLTTKTKDVTAPTKPDGLFASENTETKFKLTWNSSTDVGSGVKEYKVYLKKQSDSIYTFNQTIIAITGVNQNTVINGLTQGTAYLVYVVAVDSEENNSFNSDSVTVNTLVSPDTEVPSVPNDLTSSSVTPTSISINWAASTDNVGVTAYEVYDGSNLVGTVTGSGPNAPVTTFNVTGLNANTTYSFTVKAKDAAGNKSAASAALSVKTAVAPPPTDTTPPTAPSNLVVSSLTGNSFTLSWSASTDNIGVTGYEVYLNNSKIGRAHV